MFPVEAKLPEIRRALAENREVILSAPPGSGKTTCVPPALLNEPWLADRKIIMLEPRRLAARTCAQFMARQRGENVGETIGYQVRLERAISAATRLEVVTEGLLAQRILAEMDLPDVGLIVFDEFHERSLACDLAFALALEVRRALRPDLRLLVMSATLDSDELAAHLERPAVITAQGRMFPVDIAYLGPVSVRAALARASRETTGDILCFLPGEGEIRREAEACAAAGLDVLPLYGALPKEEQDRVFAPTAARKIILATSIAETSITLPNITAVVDSGLMRVSRFSPATGMSGLVTLPLTQDRAEQRAGRAGRVQAGVCYRLWSESDQLSRPRKMLPEILDADLASLVLTSFAWGACQRMALPWLTPPPAAAWDQACALLRLLGALDAAGQLTPKGERMSRKPLHPRLANMLLGGGDPVLAALIEEGGKSRETDIRRQADEVRETPNRLFSRRILQLAKRFSSASSSANCSEGAALARAYPDRIARNRGNATFTMVSGRGAFLDETDALARVPYLVCCELDDRPGDAKIFRACPIDEVEIRALFATQLVEEPFCAWDRRADRVKSVVCERLGAMTLAERPTTGGPTAAAMLEGIRIKGLANLPCWTRDSRQLKSRIDFAARWCDWPALTDDAFLRAIEGFLGEATKWRDLERLDLFAVMDFFLTQSGHDRRELDHLVPTRMEVPSGSHMLIHYEGDEPTVEVRLQECFGLMETPRVAGGKVPIVMTLLSPAQRPIQITKDLAGFWKGAYQLVRKDMRGRYPKHNWPEDPFSAVASRRTIKRKGDPQ